MEATIISTIISFGLGTLLGTYLKIRWERTNTAQLQKQEYKTGRYKAVIGLMYALLDFDKRNGLMKPFGRNFNTADDLIEELKTEWNNMLLYADDEVLKTFQFFIKTPNGEGFQKTVLAMRKDLWGGKLSLKPEDITL